MNRTLAMSDEKEPIIAQQVEPKIEEKAPKAAPPGAEKPPAKKEKPPAIEAKPFKVFIEEHYVPGLEAAFESAGIRPVDLQFVKQKVQVVGYDTVPECWQIQGKWDATDESRQFNVYFYTDDIQGQRGFSVTNTASKASTLESFRIDERKVTLDLLLLGVTQRLTAQKWFIRN